MQQTRASLSGDAFGYQADALGVRLIARRERLSSSLLSEAEIDAVIGGLHAELEDASTEMKTALRNILETPLFGEDV